MMANRLINNLLKFTTLSDGEVEIILESMVTRKYPKGSFLIKEGQFSSDTYFVLDGCIKQYKIVDGNYITTNFFTEEQWIISFDITNYVIPTKFNLVCLEDTTVVVGNEQKAIELYKHIPHLEIVSQKILENIYLNIRIL